MKGKLSSFIFSISPLVSIRIQGKSMYPAIQENNTVIVNKLHYLFKSPKLNDIVLAINPKKEDIRHRYLVKRITQVKKGMYFLTGDNKKESTDSREFGWVQKKNIVGKVVMLL